jgi:hypothetical protein
MKSKKLFEKLVLPLTPAEWPVSSRKICPFPQLQRSEMWQMSLRWSWKTCDDAYQKQTAPNGANFSNSF